jgi:hypothetical protein
MVEILIGALVAGAAGYYFGKHSVTQTGTDTGKDGGKGVDTDVCAAEFAKMPDAARQQLLAAVNHAKAQGGAQGAATLKGAADIIRPMYPAAAKCVDDSAIAMGGGGGGQQPATDCDSRLKALPEPTKTNLVNAVAEAKKLGGIAGASILTGFANVIRVQYPEEAKCIDTMAAQMSALPAPTKDAKIANYNPEIVRKFVEVSGPPAMMPLSMRSIIGNGTGYRR